MSWLGHPKWCSIFNQFCWWKHIMKKTAPKSKTPQVDVVLRLESCFTIFWFLFPPCTVTSFCAPAQWVNSTYTFYIYSAKLPKIVALFAVFARKPTPNKVQKKNRRKIDGQNEHHDQLTVFGGKVLWPRERGKRMLQNLFRTNDSATNKSSMNQLLPTRASNQSASVQSELHQVLPSQTVFHVSAALAHKFPRLHFHESETNTCHWMYTQTPWDTCLSHVQTLRPHCILFGTTSSPSKRIWLDQPLATLLERLRRICGSAQVVQCHLAAHEPERRWEAWSWSK